MSTSRFGSRLFTSLSDAFRSKFWLTILSVTFASSVLIVALTLTGDSAQAVGVDSGRMALSFAEFLALVAVLLGVPTVFIAVRENLGRLPFLHSFLLALVVGLSFVVVATPAMIWAVLSTGVSVDVWLPTIATTKLEVWVVALLVSLAHWAIAHHGAAIATAFGLVTAITLGPLLVLATAAFAAPVEQTTVNYYVEWKDENQVIDPATGYPENPTCQTSPTYSKQTLTDYTGVWWAIETNPVALVSASITPTVGDYEMPGYGESDGSTPMILPLDLFSTVDLTVRGMQLPVEKTIHNNECDNIAKYGTPYLSFGPGNDPRERIAATRSGYVEGVFGQGAVVVLATAILVPIRLRKRA